MMILDTKALEAATRVGSNFAGEDLVRQIITEYLEALPSQMSGAVAMETQSEHIARDIREGRFPQRSERQPAALVAVDGSLSADWVAMILAEYGRVEDGQIANGPYLAVLIAGAVDRLRAASLSSAPAQEDKS